MNRRELVRTLYLIRHGQTDWNKEGRIQGHLDVPLNETGRQQARALLEPLKKIQPQAFLSSDLSRARETAELMALPLGIQVHSDIRLREIHLGEMQGLTREEIEKKFGTEFSERVRNSPITDEDVNRLGSESGDAVTRRALAAIQKSILETQVDRLVVVSHGGVIRRLLQHAIGDGSFPPPITNCVIYPVRALLSASGSSAPDELLRLEWLPLLPHS